MDQCVHKIFCRTGTCSGYRKHWPYYRIMEYRKEPQALWLWLGHFGSKITDIRRYPIHGWHTVALGLSMRVKMLRHSVQSVMCHCNEGSDSKFL